MPPTTPTATIRLRNAQATDILVAVEDGGLHAAEIDWVPNEKDWQQDIRDDSRATYWSRKLGTGSNKG